MKPLTKSVFLLPLFIAYIFLGALVFLKIEGDQAVRARHKLFSFLARFTVNHSTCMTSDELLDLMAHFAEVKTQGFINPSHVNYEDGQLQTVWSWTNSIVFASTIVTTIGYGRLVPRTTGGRVFCIVFAIIGIPLCYKMLSVVGDTFQSLWYYSIRFFDKVASCVRSKSGRKALGCLITCAVLWVFLVMVPAAIFAHTEGWSLVKAQYFGFVSLSTIGFGDIIYGFEDELETLKQEWLYKLGILLYLLISLSVISIVFKGVWRAQKARIRSAQKTTRHFWKNRNGKHRSYSLGTLSSPEAQLPLCSFTRKTSSEVPVHAHCCEDEAIESALATKAVVTNQRKASVFGLSYNTVANLQRITDQDSGRGSANNSFVGE